MSGKEVDVTGAKLNRRLVKDPKYPDEPWRKAHVPRKHRLTVQPLAGQTMAAFNHNSSGKKSSEGQVGKKRARFQPTDAKVDVRLEKFPRTEPPRLADRPSPSFKPVASHPYHVRTLPRTRTYKSQEARKKRKEEGRRTGGKKMSVVDVLFSAFDERPSQHLKELMDVTQKGQKHLKKILKEIGTYNPAGGPKHTWQLKPEYSLNNVGIN